MKIHEAIVTTCNVDGSAHIRPMGVHAQGAQWIIAPFIPSNTLANIERTGQLVVNMTDDVRIFAGCLTGRDAWPTVATEHVTGWRLQDSLMHMELAVAERAADPVRPRFFCDSIYQQQHAPFTGFNRAQAAVLEATILVSRLHSLPREKIATEMDYLQIAVEKTAGDKEQCAWQWLLAKVAEHNAQSSI